ncbi:hypothetical protein IL306_007349 [Fusarium sp. DS 682]|nr:hypothetical protein IL306_007349 [Fusarium sp. DS 682]
MSGEPSKMKPTEENWDFFQRVARHHHRNRLAHADFAELRRALPLLKQLRILVLSNRNANESFSQGAQSRVSSSPVVRMWKRFQSGTDEHVPLAPRCDWWGSAMDIDDRSRVNRMDWLHDRLADIMSNITTFSLDPGEFSVQDIVDTDSGE